MRSVASPFQAEGIRTYALCPGTVRTNLLSQSAWDTFPEEYLTPVETIVSTVNKLIQGGEMEDGKGRKVSRAENYGLAVEVFCKEFYVRDQLEFINDGMRLICEAARLDNQRSNLK